MIYCHLLPKPWLANHEDLNWNSQNPHKTQAWQHASVTPALLQPDGSKTQENQSPRSSQDKGAPVSKVKGKHQHLRFSSDTHGKTCAHTWKDMCTHMQRNIHPWKDMYTHRKASTPHMERQVHTHRRTYTHGKKYTHTKRHEHTWKDVHNTWKNMYTHRKTCMPHTHTCTRAFEKKNPIIDLGLFWGLHADSFISPLIWEKRM